MDKDHNVEPRFKTVKELREFMLNRPLVICEPSDDIRAANRRGTGFTANDIEFLEEMGLL